MQQIANLNVQLQSGNTTDAAAAALKDQRDQYVDQLSQLMDIRVIDNGNNQIQVFTNSGVQLVGAEASTLSFNPQGTVTPNTQWDADPTKSNARHPHAPFPERRFAQPDSDQFDPLRHHRRLSRVARQNAGAGANPA